MSNKEIPIMFCFDNNYVIPAAVAFYSMLENADKEYNYKLYVLHTDISLKNQKKLKQNIEKFSDFSELIFVNMENKFEDLWQTISTKGHFSKEVMYKVLVASIFPIYEKIIVSDVDVVFLNDISKSYLDFDINEDNYLAGIKIIGKMKWYMDQYLNTFSEEEVEKLSGFCGGYVVFNLKKLREDKMEEKFVKCFQEEGYRINQMEQDILNLCCYPKTKKLPLKYLACSYMWDKYKTEEDKNTDIYYSREEIEDAMENTVQLHYATSTKPWKNVDCTKSEIWFEYIAKTNYLKEYLENLPKKIVLPIEKIEEIEKNTKELMKEEIKNQIVEDVKKSYSLRGKINSKYGNTRIYRITKYIVRNPLFLFSKTFYKKIIKKIQNRMDKEDFSLIVLDDIFPSIYSPFRYEEYMEYLKNLKSVFVFSTGSSLLAVNEERNLKEVIEEFESKYPEYKKTVIDRRGNIDQKISEIKNKLAIMTFLQNVQSDKYNNLEFLEKNKIPFIFTLYPGGGFVLNNEKSDKKLKQIFSSKYFRKVIVTQKNTYDYLINKGFCTSKDIKFIYGIVTPKEILKSNMEDKLYYNENKNVLDICFVAHKYSEKGIDKGYDLFIEAAKKLVKKYKNIKFHVIGGFSEKDIDVSEISNNICFYGIKESKWFEEFYKKMDIILSPNRPFKLNKGSFDGFPTGGATEAMINGVLLICTDELKLNAKFKVEKEIIIVKPLVEDIIEKIENLYKNPQKIKEIANAGRKKAINIYSLKQQISPRIKLIKKEAKKYYKY